MESYIWYWRDPNLQCSLAIQHCLKVLRISEAEVHWFAQVARNNFHCLLSTGYCFLPIKEYLIRSTLLKCRNKEKISLLHITSALLFTISWTAIELSPAVGEHKMADHAAPSLECRKVSTQWMNFAYNRYELSIGASARQESYHRVEKKSDIGVVYSFRFPWRL